MHYHMILLEGKFMAHPQQIYALTKEQLECIEDVLLGLNYLQHEFAKAHLMNFANAIQLCKSHIITLSTTPQTHEPLAQEPLHASESLDRDLHAMLELLEKYTSIQDAHTRKELIDTIQFSENRNKIRVN
jgi:hypothetical protein